MALPSQTHLSSDRVRIAYKLDMFQEQQLVFIELWECMILATVQMSAPTSLQLSVKTSFMKGHDSSQMNMLCLSSYHLLQNALISVIMGHISDKFCKHSQRQLELWTCLILSLRFHKSNVGKWSSTYSFIMVPKGRVLRNADWFPKGKLIFHG